MAGGDNSASRDMGRFRYAWHKAGGQRMGDSKGDDPGGPDRLAVDATAEGARAREQGIPTQGQQHP